MKKLALILAFVMCFTSTMFFGGCNNLNPTLPNTNQTEVEEDNTLNNDNNSNSENIANGSQSPNVIKVYNKQDLINLANLPGSKSDYTILICANINLESSPGVKGDWTPIPFGNWGEKMCTIDGQGFAISNFKVTEVSSGVLFSNGGLFSTIEGKVTIKNLTIKNAEIKGTYSAGGLVGRIHASDVIIQNCTVSNSTVKAIYNNQTTFKFDNGNINRTIYVGGLIGYTLNGKIFNCMNMGTSVSVDTLSSIPNEITGDGVTDGKTNYACVGGIVGMSREDNSNDCKIENCLNSGTINGGYFENTSLSNGLKRKLQVIRAGGIVGINHTSNVSYNGFEINSCFNKGTIKAGHSYEADETGNMVVTEAYAGGIAGVSTNTISNCGNMGDVTAIAKKEVTSNTFVKLSDQESFFGKKLVNLEEASSKIYLGEHEYSYWSIVKMYRKDKYYFSGTSGYIFQYEEMNAYAGGISGYSTNTCTNVYNVAKIYGGGKYLEYYYSNAILIEDYHKQLFIGYQLEQTTNVSMVNSSCTRSVSYATGIVGNALSVKDLQVLNAYSLGDIGHYVKVEDESEIISTGLYPRITFTTMETDSYKKRIVSTEYFEKECTVCDERYSYRSSEAMQITDKETLYNNLSSEVWGIDVTKNDGYPYLKSLYF